MKQQNLNVLLHTESKDITHNTLTSIQSLETLEEIEALQQAHNKDSNKVPQDSIKLAESLAVRQSLMQDSQKHAAITHLHNRMASLETHILANSTKNPYKNIANSNTQTHIGDIKHKKKVYVAVGDINGVGLELILRNHALITQWCIPIYCVDEIVLQNAAQLLNMEIPNDMYIVPLDIQDTPITPGVVCAKSGLYSFFSFYQAVELSIEHNAPLVTLPIHKYAWQLAGIEYAGHTQYLRERFQQDAIMMLGCEAMFVALYTDHIPLNKVASMIQKEPLLQFFRDFYHAYSAIFMPAQNITQENDNKTPQDSKQLSAYAHHIIPQALKKHAISAKMVKRLLHDTQSINKTHTHSNHYITDSIQPSKSATNNTTHIKPLQIAVLGLNPHAGDNGVLGQEDILINECIACINNEIGSEVFVGAFAPDSAFIPNNRKLYNVFIAMYHDSGLAPLKALYFDKSINVSLNLPILRTSPDHGTCFDKAYKNNNDICMDSYLESFKFLLRN